jgi:hypothetical protein
MAPASTGRDRSNRTAVINTDQTNSGISSIVDLVGRMFRIVVMKLIAPKIEETPARCSEKIVMSTEDPAWKILLERGG